MPVIPIERLAADGPFKLGVSYGFADDHFSAKGDQHFEGIVREVAPIGDDGKRVRTTLELSEDEHERLLASRR